MTIKYEVEGDNAAFQREIELLKIYPEISDKHFYPAMEKAAELVKRASPRCCRTIPGSWAGRWDPRSSTAARLSLGTRADIGFGKRYGKPCAPYAAALNAGPVAHEVAGRRTSDGLLHFSSQGRFTSIGTHPAPGFRRAAFCRKWAGSGKPRHQRRNG